jgi:hypothetical protein
MKKEEEVAGVKFAESFEIFSIQTKMNYLKSILKLKYCSLACYIHQKISV